MVTVQLTLKKFKMIYFFKKKLNEVKNNPNCLIDNFM